MSAIKKFFAKKKLDVKFKQAGGGHKLTEEQTTSSHKAQKSQPDHAAYRSAPTVDAQRAGLAAMDRVNRPKPAPKQNIKEQARKELEAERKHLDQLQISGPPKLVQNDAVPMAKILFNCPDVGPVVLPKNEMEEYIEEFLLCHLDEEPEMTSTVMIQTLNKDKEKVRVCIETLSKYLENIISNPGEDKYCKIKISNKIFQERVAPIRGALEFLKSVGFHQKNVMVEEEEVEFLWLNEDSAVLTERLVNLREILQAAEPIVTHLDRNLTVYHPTNKAERFAISDDFYNISPEEVKREQEIRREAVEKMGMLRTKAMRERDEIRELRRYRYTLIRVRFPDGLLIQGTFKATEPVKELYSFVSECLVNDWLPFKLTTMLGKTISIESTQTLAEEGLAPSVILNFAWDESMSQDIAATSGIVLTAPFLKPFLLQNIQCM